MPSLVAPTTNAMGMPTEIRFDQPGMLPSGKIATIPIYTFEQLEQMPIMTLKNKAKGLVDEFPLFTRIHEIAFEGKDPASIVEL